MYIDKEKIFGKTTTVANENRNEWKNHARVMPGFFFLLFIFLPLFFLVLLSKFESTNHILFLAKILEFKIVIILICAVAGVMMEFRQPFSVNYSKQGKKGKTLRALAFIILMIIVVFLCYLIYLIFSSNL